jgi:hypothetical protein
MSLARAILAARAADSRGYRQGNRIENLEAGKLRPPATATPASNGDMVFELTNNTTLTIKVKGSDGVVRSATLTLT